MFHEQAASENSRITPVDIQSRERRERDSPLLSQFLREFFIDISQHENENLFLKSTS